MCHFARLAGNSIPAVFVCWFVFVRVGPLTFARCCGRTFTSSRVLVRASIRGGQDQRGNGAQQKQQGETPPKCRTRCEGCDIVQSDHAPQAGVAQGIFNGDLIRRRDGHQVELEEELDEEVERRVRRDHSRDKTQVRMHG